MSKLFFEVLTKNQKAVLPLLKEFSKYGILAGGTALALQLYHRESYDLDIFVSKPISKKFLYKIKQHFKKIEIIVDTGDEFSFISLPHKVKVSFVYYPFPPLYKTIPNPYLKIFSWKDIALDKAHTIGRRGEWRDYIDLYFVIKNGFKLKDIIKKSEKKFGDTFSEKLFLSQLCYYEDIKDFSVELIDKEITKEKVQRFFEKEVGKIEI